MIYQQQIVVLWSGQLRSGMLGTRRRNGMCMGPGCVLEMIGGVFVSTVLTSCSTLCRSGIQHVIRYDTIRHDTILYEVV